MIQGGITIDEHEPEQGRMSHSGGYNIFDKLQKVVDDESYMLEKSCDGSSNSSDGESTQY